MQWNWRGKAWVFGDDVPNDNGFMPISFVRSQVYDAAVLARSAFADLDPTLAPKIAPGDILVGGKNFGRGNPHVQGFLGLKGLGVGVLAESMSRGPLRACVNAGVPVLVAPTLREFAQNGDLLAVNFETGLVANETRGTSLQLPPLHDLMRAIIGAGGGLEFSKRRLGL
ncbi:MAG: hypothetical protein ABIQ72_18160 [Usitatibacter sp.]